MAIPTSDMVDSVFSSISDFPTGRRDRYRRHPTQIFPGLKQSRIKLLCTRRLSMLQVVQSSSIWPANRTHKTLYLSRANPSSAPEFVRSVEAVLWWRERQKRTVRTERKKIGKSSLLNRIIWRPRGAVLVLLAAFQHRGGNWIFRPSPAANRDETTTCQLPKQSPLSFAQSQPSKRQHQLHQARPSILISFGVVLEYKQEISFGLPLAEEIFMWQLFHFHTRLTHSPSHLVMRLTDFHFEKWEVFPFSNWQFAASIVRASDYWTVYRRFLK